MDVRTAVAASMLPASRAAVAAAFRELRHDDAAHGPASAFLELLWSVCRQARRRPRPRFRELMAAAAAALETGERRGIVAIPLFDERYPPLLACINDPPPVLWARGDFETLARPAVAVIGSRAASPYALAGWYPNCGRARRARYRGGQRAGKRRRFGGPPWMSGGAAAQPRRCWGAASIGSIHPSMPIWRLR